MAFSPDSKPFKNSAFCCSVEVMGKWEPVPFSLGNYSCRNEGVWGGEDVGVRWNWGSSKMGKKRLTLDTTRAFVFTPRALRPLGEDSPIELLSVFRAHIKSLLRKPSWGRREREKNNPDSLLLSEPFVWKWDERLLRDVNGNLCKYTLKASSIQRVTQL